MEFIKINRRAGACLPPQGEAIHPTPCHPERSNAERSRTGLICAERSSRGYECLPPGGSHFKTVDNRFGVASNAARERKKRACERRAATIKAEGQEVAAKPTEGASGHRNFGFDGTGSCIKKGVNQEHTLMKAYFLYPMAPSVNRQAVDTSLPEGGIVPPCM